jgi:hypothetical protein
MTNAVATGYDWLHGILDDKTRTTLHDAILRLGLAPGLAAYEKKKYWFPRGENNWNQVCNFGLTVGALAVADTDPDVANRILAGALKSLPKAMQHYAPDGAWMEGPGYWNYATRYTCYGIAALDTALGRDLGTSKYPGFSVSGYFPIYGAGSTGCYLCFADAGMLSRRRALNPLFFLARKYKCPAFADGEHEILRDNRADAYHVIWYQPPSGRAHARDLDRYFDGPVEVASLRTRWGDPDALWVGVKAGYNKVPHGHLDLGNFELDALGARWAVDLGSDNYNLPGYWDGKEGGKRWSYYRLNSHSHNVPTLDGKNQLVAGKAAFVKWHARPDEGAAVIDLTTAYREVARAARGVRLLRRQNVVLVQDEFGLKGPRDLLWGMTTPADIRIESDGSATLTCRKKTLRVFVLAPEKARFEAGSAERKKPDRDNKGMKRLRLRLKQVSGAQRVAVLFVPGGAPRAPSVAVKPLAQWPGKSMK